MQIRFLNLVLRLGNCDWSSATNATICAWEVGGRIVILILRQKQNKNAEWLGLPLKKSPWICVCVCVTHTKEIDRQRERKRKMIDSCGNGDSLTLEIPGSHHIYTRALYSLLHFLSLFSLFISYFFFITIYCLCWCYSVFFLISVDCGLKRELHLSSYLHSDLRSLHLRTLFPVLCFSVSNFSTENNNLKAKNKKRRLCL